MLYTQEELPESVFKSLLAAPHARKIFSSVYNQVFEQYEHKGGNDYRKKNEVAIIEAWKAVREAYGLGY